jgi:hypothetical protein
MKGFTLIKLMVCVAAGGIIASAFLAAASDTSREAISHGITGYIETRCISGFQFIVSNRGHMTQILDNNGHGVSCQ